MDIINKKLNQLKNKLLTEKHFFIKYAKVEKAMKNQKVEFDSAFSQLQMLITKLEVN